MPAIGRAPLPAGALSGVKTSLPKNCPLIARSQWQACYLPDTILTRSVVIEMRRRAPNETVEPFRRRLELKEGERLRERLALWAKTVHSKVQDTFPAMPDGIEDRNADVWEALISVADAAGGAGPEQSRAAAVRLLRF